LALVERDDPEPGPGELVIDVRGSGLCHSDVMEWKEAGADFTLGKIMGHELAGEISDVGEGVDTWQVGDRVAVCPTRNTPGFFRDGGFADKFVGVPDDLVRVPDDVDWTYGAMMTDAGMTSYHALVKRGGMKAGMKVGIIGLGGLGQIAARIAVLLGGDVHVAEPKQTVWPLGERLGVNNFVADANEWADGRFDLIVDYAGFGSTTAAAVRSVRARGTVVQVGLGVPEAALPVGDIVSKEVALLGSRGGTKDDIAELYEFVASGDLAPEATVIGFDDIPQGLQDLADNNVTGRLVALM
jgi:propanol-preferring alcohol dehydrogenase